ncbi:putative BOI-related E3 ubiquitin-protein ligase 3 [Iris pallida]|uniref:BOI-related E3 ubiquitin-protein ligase 3 n=1 Tax=Iris pallida TaxID=29817 RepID=A0AAX6HYK9_IRIPA|nr:putative BOI-related E3 ubiquitin-protein ligase 3 [Iris pallida]
MQQQHLVGAFFSGPPIDMTCCDASGMRKRARDRQELPSVLVDMNSNVDSLPSHFRHDEQPAARLVGSTGASTSGRPAAISPPLAVDLYSHLYQHNIEIDAIIRLQTERLRLVVEESRKRQWRAVVENSKVAMKRLREKEMELEVAKRKNAELEERMGQLSSENHVWFSVAKNNEAIASTLKSSLEQLLLLRVNASAAAAPDVTVGDDDGDGECASNVAVHSCCFEGDYAVREGTARAGRTRKCRVCSRNDVGVLLLPCRHLCVCEDCESKVDTCPICNGSKNACLQIFMS